MSLAGRDNALIKFGVFSQSPISEPTTSRMIIWLLHLRLRSFHKNVYVVDKQNPTSNDKSINLSHLQHLPVSTLFTLFYGVLSNREKLTQNS